MAHASHQTVAVLTKLVSLGIWITALAVGQDKLSELLANLEGGSFDRSVLHALEAQPSNPKITEALETAFRRKTAKDEKQAIAATLLRLGNKAPKYFDFLAGYARVAVEDRTPSFIKVDSNGRSVRGEFSAEFENWCASHGENPKSVAAIQSGTYPQDLEALASVQDPRAREIFRKGLDSPQPLVVVLSVEGLGRLQDAAAIPLIAQASEHISEGTKLAVATKLPWFASAEADRMLEHLAPERKYRESCVAEVQRLRLGELKTILSRTGAAAQKQ
jgi:hypothetical protein